MKKFLSMVLTLVLCLSLCACGSASKENVVGTYAYASGIYDGVDHEGDTLSLHDDFTYDWGGEKGTYKISGNKIVLTSKYNRTTTLVKQGDFIYYEVFESIEDDYGQTKTFSKEGRINHKFQWWVMYNNQKSDTTRLTLREDGSFTFDVRTQTGPGYDNVYTSNEFEGTYSLENNILTLTGEDVTYYLVCTNEGITQYVLKKQSSETVRGNVDGPVEAPIEEYFEEGPVEVPVE